MTNLRIPGPTPCPDHVLQAMSRQMINHRGPEFAAILKRVTSNLQTLFQTKNDVLILTSGGTGAMEAMVVNFLSPGDHVIVVSVGVFGDRFAQICEAYGARVTRLAFPLGEAADPAQLDAALAANPDVKAVLVTHNETSTGVTNDLEALAAVINKHGKLSIVDAISSLGSIRLPVDAWGLDVVGTGSQKGWMVPPGLAMVSVSERAWKAYEQARMPRFYFDLKKAKDFFEKGQTPWTPAISVFYALDVALQQLVEEGIDNVVARHQRIADLARAGVEELGLELLVKNPAWRSNTVTAIVVPEGVDGPAVSKLLREEYDVVIGGGQGALTGKIWRLGHLGYCTEADIEDALAKMKLALERVGFSPSGVGAVTGG